MSCTPQHIITIKYSGYHPPLIVKKWKVFDINLKNKKNKFKSLEKKLGFENYCITILKTAFEKRFSRVEGWIIKNDKYKNAYIQASKIYKRGVQYKIQGMLPNKAYIKKSSYDINIFDVNDNELTQILIKYKTYFFIIVLLLSGISITLRLGNSYRLIADAENFIDAKKFLEAETLKTNLTVPNFKVILAHF